MNLTSRAPRPERRARVYVYVCVWVRGLGPSSSMFAAVTSAHHGTI